MERHLAAIFAADMVGYSRLMEADETGTLTRQKRHRAELIDPTIERHHGRIVKLTGDGMIAEFPSVVEAVQCAVLIQSEMADREADIPEVRRIRYRIAINLGDVIFDEGDVYGDGVNIAARLEALADPGGVVVSGTAYDHLKANVEVGYEDLGERQVKNIATPVRVYRVVPEGAAPVQQGRPRRRWSVLVPAAAAVLMLLVAGLWWSGALDGTAEADPVLALPEGPRIVVLPFDNLSGDPTQDFFVDGLTEDLTTRLTEHGYLFVIGRTTAFKYKGKSPDVREVGRDLGVDYVVEGSIRRSGERIRVSAQLLDATDGTLAWAKTYDRELDVTNLFAIQDELSIGIGAAVGGTKGAIAQVTMRRIGSKLPSDLSAFECVLSARSFWNSFDMKLHQKAKKCLEATVDRDPNFARGWAELSRLHRWEYESGVNPNPDGLRLAKELNDAALRLDPTSHLTYQHRAWLMLLLQREEEAIHSLDKMLSLSPNFPYGLHTAALTFTHLGQSELGIAIWRKAIALDPNPISWSYWTPFHFHRNRKEYEEAYRYVLILKQLTGGWHWVPATEAYILAYMGRMDEAREALDRALEIDPDFAKTARDEISVWWWSQPQEIDHIMEGLYLAGLPRSGAPTQ